MEPLSEAMFARRFRALSAHERRTFLARVWEARGYHTRIEDGRIIARRVRANSEEPTDTSSAGPTGETLTIAVAGPTGYGCAGADIIVTTRETSLVRRAAGNTGAEIVPPAKLLEKLLYGIERDTATTIVAEQLGGSLFGTPTESEGAPISRPIGMALIGGVIILIILGSSGVAFPINNESGIQGESSLNGTASAPTPAPEAESSSPFPNGMNASGVTDPTKAAMAHRTAVDGSPREVRFDYAGTENDPPFRAITEYSSKGRYVDDTQYLIASAGTSTDGEQIAREQFSKNGVTLLRRQLNNETIYNKTQSRRGFRWDRYEETTTNLYTAVLSANQTSLQQVEKPGRRVYQLNFKGAPSEPLRNTEDFGAVAYVAGNGQLTQLTIQYTHAPSGEQVRIVIGTQLIDDTVIEEPEWHEEAVDRTA